MPSFDTPLKIATKGAETAFKVGAVVVGGAAQRIQSLLDRDGGERYAPTAPVAAPPVDTTAKPSTAKTTATGPGGTPTAPKAAAPKAPAAPKVAAKTGTGGRISNPKAAKAVRKRTAAATAKSDANKGTTKSSS
jgi:hypothetical protein